MKKTIFILFSILLGGFIVRLYHFSYPVADWHSWRQADTSAVSRNFVREGFDLLHPKFDDLSNVPSGIYDNPEGYRFVEFPIYNVLQAGGFVLFDKFNLEEWGRLVSIFSSILSVLLLYFLVSRYSTKTIGLFSAFFFAFLPFNIYWSRTILPDSTVITTTLSGLLFFDLWIRNYDKKNLRKFFYFFLSAIFLALALLLKPFAIFFFLPVAWTAFQKWGIYLFKKKEIILLSILFLTPWILWRSWSIQFPAGVPQSGWLFNEGNIRFKGSYFHWIFAERIAGLILGSWGLIIFAFGFLTKNKSYFYSFLLASLFYLVVVARGNVQHSYYQIPIIPGIAIFLALGTNFLLNPPKVYFSKILTVPLLIMSLLFMFAFSWFEVRDYYNIQDPAVTSAGLAVQRLTPKDSKIIAPYDGDTTLLYLSNRKGWPSFSKPTEELKKLGADYLVLVHTKDSDFELGKIYRIMEATPDYIIFDLRSR